jgi:hypothetical protein
MEEKVEIHEDYILKYNTSKYTENLEKITEFFSINHNREIRVYKLYEKYDNASLLIPKAFELNKKYIKIEKIIESEKKDTIKTMDLVPALLEFLNLSKRKNKLEFSDYLSSPTLSVIRGSFFNLRFLGVVVFLRGFKYLFKLYKNRPKLRRVYLIHKDLKKNQNIVQAQNGIYFIDFGSSILTANYFLTDIIELSLDVNVPVLDFNPVIAVVKELGFDQSSLEYIRAQIYILLYRRFLHLHPTTKLDLSFMKRSKKFLINLEEIVNEIEII